MGSWSTYEKNGDVPLQTVSLPKGNDGDWWCEMVDFIIFTHFNHGQSWSIYHDGYHNVVKQCHKPAMARNGQHTTFKNGDDWGMVLMTLFYPLQYHYSPDYT